MGCHRQLSSNECSVWLITSCLQESWLHARRYESRGLLKTEEHHNDPLFVILHLDLRLHIILQTRLYLQSTIRQMRKARSHIASSAMEGDKRYKTTQRLSAGKRLQESNFRESAVVEQLVGKQISMEAFCSPLPSYTPLAVGLVSPGATPRICQRAQQAHHDRPWL